MTAVVKSHNRLKGTKVFAKGVLEQISKFFEICREEPVLGSFIVKLKPVIAYKRLLSQLYQKRDAYTETLTRVLSANFEKNI